MNTKQLAKKFLKLVYERIAHGDEQHREWLRLECVKLEADFRELFQPSKCTCKHKDGEQKGLWLCEICREIAVKDMVEKMKDMPRPGNPFPKQSNVRPMWYDVDMLDDPAE